MHNLLRVVSAGTFYQVLLDQKWNKSTKYLSTLVNNFAIMKESLGEIFNIYVIYCARYIILIQIIRHTTSMKQRHKDYEGSVSNSKYIKSKSNKSYEATC